MHRPLIIDPVTSNQIGQSSHFSPIRHYQTKLTILMAPQIPPLKIILLQSNFW